MRKKGVWIKPLKIVAVCAVPLAVAAAFWAIRPKENAPPPCDSYTKCLALGRGLREAGKLKKAAVALDAAARLKPGDTTANVELANDYIAMGRYEAAKKCFARLRKEGGDTLESYIREGYAGMIAGRDSEALAAFKKAVAQAPSNSEGYIHLGTYMTHHGRKREAEKYFRMALERAANDDASGKSGVHPPLPYNRLHIVGSLADLLVQSGRFAEAESLLHRELPMTPPRAAGWRSWFLVLLGDIDCARGKLATAEGYYRKAVKACERPAACSMPYASFARCEADHGRQTKARRLAARAESLAFPERPAVPVLNPAASLSQVGHLYLEIGDLAGAERMFERVIAYYAHAPHSLDLARAMTNLADVRRRQGRLRDAEALLDQALAIDEANGSAGEEAWVRSKLESIRHPPAQGKPGAPAPPPKTSKKLLRQMQAQGYW